MQGMLTIEVNEHVNRIVGKDAQQLIKSGCVVQKIAKLYVAQWSHLVVEHNWDLYNFVMEKMKELKATTTMATKETYKKEVGYIPGQFHGCSATKKHTVEFE